MSQVRRVCLAGCGVVNGAVRDWIDANPDTGIQLVRVIRRKPEGALETSSIDISGVDTLVEAIGGTDEAWDIVHQALSQGLTVVTANKRLVASKMRDIEALTKRHGGRLAFEAAVCGGVPLLHSIRRGIMLSDVPICVYGIMNGTSNFLLTYLAAHPSTPTGWDNALEDARRLGYAESSVEEDVTGRDARDKVVILRRLLFGIQNDLDSVLTHDFRCVPKEWFPTLVKCGYAIRQIAYADRSKVHVVSSVVPRVSQLGCTDDANNCVVVETKNLGRVAFYGPGAGGRATANSVVGDLLGGDEGDSFGPLEEQQVPQEEEEVRCVVGSGFSDPSCTDVEVLDETCKIVKGRLRTVIEKSKGAMLLVLDQ